MASPGRCRRLLATLAGLGALAAGCALPPPQPTTKGQAEILFHWGVGGRNRLDTISETLVKDMIGDPPLVVRFPLSAGEKRRIIALADSLGFFDQPVHVAPPDTAGIRHIAHPCEEYLLRISVGSWLHTSYWTTCDRSPCVECDRAATLGRLLSEYIEGRPGFQRLPAAQGYHQ
jgi:hypothetical protein